VLNPLSGEFEQAMAFFGMVYEQDNFFSFLDNGCLSFTTRHQGAADNKPALEMSMSFLLYGL
jgi:hypothetical protein